METVDLSHVTNFKNKTMTDPSLWLIPTPRTHKLCKTSITWACFVRRSRTINSQLILVLHSLMYSRVYVSHQRTPLNFSSCLNLNGNNDTWSDDNCPSTAITLIHHARRVTHANDWVFLLLEMTARICVWTKIIVILMSYLKVKWKKWRWKCRSCVDCCF